jgi:uncharacterized membrane protein required for colicin V production
MQTPDIVLFAVLALFLAFGAISGLVRILYRLASTLVSFLTMVFLAPPVAAAIQHLPLFDGPRAAIRDFLLKNAGSASDSLATAIGSVSLPEVLRTSLLAGIADPSRTLSDGADSLAASLFLFALTAAVGLAMFLVVMVVLALLTRVAEAALHKVPFFERANRLLGGVLGLAEGFLFVFVLLGILGLVAPSFPEAVATVEGAQVLGFLYRNNPLLALLAR